MSTPPQQPEEPTEKPVQEPAEGQAPPAPPTPEAESQASTPAEGEAEPKPPSHALRNIALIVGGLFVAIVAGFLIGRSGQEAPTGAVSATQAVATPSPSPAPSPSPQPSPSPKPSPSPQPNVLVDIQGTGSGQTDPFSAPNEWKLTYTFECPDGGPPGIAVDLYQGDTMVKELVSDARSSGEATTLVSLGGSNLHLLIRALDCSWRVTATT